MYIFEYEKSELNMFIMGKVVSMRDKNMPKVRGIFYDVDDGLEIGEINYPMSGEEKFYNTAEEMMRKAIPYIFEEWK